MVPHITTKFRTMESGVYNPALRLEDDRHHHHHQTSDSPTGLILGIVFAIVGSLIVATLGWCMLIRRKKHKNKKTSEFESSIHASRVSSIAQDEEPPDIIEYPGDEKSHKDNSLSSSPSPPPSSSLSSSSSPSSSSSSQDLRSVASTSLPSQPSIHSTVSSVQPSIHSITPSLVSQPSVQSLSFAPGPSNPTMTILSQSQPTPRQSSETARGSFDCPPWSRDSRFQEFF